MIPDNMWDEYDFSNYIRISMRFNEGNVIIVDSVKAGGEGRVPTFTNQLRKGNYVKLTNERLTVKKVEDFDEDIILGIVHAKGRFDNGVEPLRDANYGDYTSRKGTILINAKAFKTYKVANNNSEIKIGDKIKIVGVEYNEHTHEMDALVDKGTKDNETFALSTVPANSIGGYVDVLHEFKPINGSV